MEKKLIGRQSIKMSLLTRGELGRLLFFRVQETARANEHYVIFIIIIRWTNLKSKNKNLKSVFLSFTLLFAFQSVENNKPSNSGGQKRRAGDALGQRSLTILFTSVFSKHP